MRACTSGVARKEGRCKKKCHHRESGTRPMVSPTKDTLNLTHISFVDLEIDMDISTLSSPPKYTVKRKCSSKEGPLEISTIPNLCKEFVLKEYCYKSLRGNLPHTHTQNSRGDKFHYGIQLMDFFLTISARA